MRVRVLAKRLSLAEGLAHPGDELDLSDEQASRLVDLGWAEAVAEPPVLDVEAAALADPPENAVLPRARKRG